MNIAIILAGGVGKRVGADIPKQFIKIQGKPLVAYTIEKFQNHPQIDAIEVVCIESYLDEMEALKETYSFSKIRWITRGGSDCQQSVMNGIFCLEGQIEGEDIVVVHFGASPFVEEDIITDAISVCREKGNAISTTDFYLLPGLKEDEASSKIWVDRTKIACMNSPHAFRFSFIYELYREAVKEDILDRAEPHTTSLMQYMGKTVFFSKGTQSNIKVTTKEDLELFEGYVLKKRKDLEGRKKIALITQRETLDSHKIPIDSLEKNYLDYFSKFGITLLPVSNFTDDLDVLADWKWDMLILSGGGPPPGEVCEEPEEEHRQLNRERVENFLIKKALENDKAIIGICRGMQVINIYFGGHVSVWGKKAEDASLKWEHPVIFIDDKMTATVNHFHCYWIAEKDMAKGFDVIAIDKENGAVEAFRHPKHKILGFQWHPERSAAEQHAEERTADIICTFLGLKDELKCQTNRV